MPNRTGFRKKIDTVHWTYGSFQFLAQGAGTAAVNVHAAQHLPETCMRTRGEWVSYVDGVQSTAVLVSVGVGYILVPEGTGTTVLWSPIADGDAPWFWVDYFMIGSEEIVADVLQVAQLSGARRIIDSKAMRKVRNREVQCVCEVATVAGAASINAVGQTRILCGA